MKKTYFIMHCTIETVLYANTKWKKFCEIIKDSDQLKIIEIKLISVNNFSKLPIQFLKDRV